jgi:hypothetical protein
MPSAPRFVLVTSSPSSYYFRVKPKVKGGSKQLIAGDRDLDGLIKATDFDNLDLLPADFSFRNLDLVLDERKKPTQRLKNSSARWLKNMKIPVASN